MISLRLVTVLASVAPALAIAAVTGLVISLAGCANLPKTTSTTVAVASPEASATPSASPSSSPSPGACGAQVTNAVYVAISSTITATNDPTYGAIFGYALTDSNGNAATTTTPLVLRPNDVVQFYNAEPAATAPSHSAVGFSTASFPAVPYAFPSADASAFATVIGASWSTGRIPINGVGICFSQAFTVPSSGVYYFGDLDYYNLTNMRDVIVVSSTANI